MRTKSTKKGKTAPGQSTGPTIAEILHLAADRHLWNDWPQVGTAEYSCYAIGRACYSLRASIRLELSIYKGLKRMGLKTTSLTQFDSIKHNRQGARYAWLKFAAMIAEEQGV